MNVKIKLSEKLIKDIISRSPNSFLAVNQVRLQWKAPELHLVAVPCQGRKKELKIKLTLLLNHSKMQFLLLASHLEARQRRQTANKLFFLLYFAVRCHLLFYLRKNSLLFPNPQPIAKPLPEVGPKLNKSVVWKRKLLGWRRAQHRGHTAPS